LSSAGFPQPVTAGLGNLGWVFARQGMASPGVNGLTKQINNLPSFCKRLFIFVFNGCKIAALFSAGGFFSFVALELSSGLASAGFGWASFATIANPIKIV